MSGSAIPKPNSNVIDFNKFKIKKVSPPPGSRYFPPPPGKPIPPPVKPPIRFPPLARKLIKFGGAAAGAAIDLGLDLLFPPPGGTPTLDDPRIPEYLRKNNPGSKIIVDPPGEPPFHGGQETGVRYKFIVEFKNTPSSNWVRQVVGGSLGVLGPVTNLQLRLNSGINIDYDRQGFPEVEGTGRSGYFLLRVNNTQSFTFGFTGVWQIASARFIAIVRADNRPDTAGDPPPINAGIAGAAPAVAPPAVPKAPPKVPVRKQPGKPNIVPFKRPKKAPKRTPPPPPPPNKEPSPVPPPIIRPPKEPVKKPAPEPIKKPSPGRNPQPRQPQPQPKKKPSPAPVKKPQPAPLKQPSPEPVKNPQPDGIPRPGTPQTPSTPNTPATPNTPTTPPPTPTTPDAPPQKETETPQGPGRPQIPPGSPFTPDKTKTPKKPTLVPTPPPTPLKTPITPGTPDAPGIEITPPPIKRIPGSPALPPGLPPQTIPDPQTSKPVEPPPIVQTPPPCQPVTECEPTYVKKIIDKLDDRPSSNGDGDCLTKPDIQDLEDKIDDIWNDRNYPIDGSLIYTDCEDNSTDYSYSGQAFAGLKSMLEAIHANLLRISDSICNIEPIATQPDWWQVRVGQRPQLVVAFRAGDKSPYSYHEICLPHPNSIAIPDRSPMPTYDKGSNSGILTLNDNSKFTINCLSKEEAMRMVAIAKGLINPKYLAGATENYCERKGVPIIEEKCRPIKAALFDTGQRNLNPLWQKRFDENS